MNKAFVYCWTDHKTNKLYVGSHKGGLDDGYICSSRVMLEEYEKRPQDFSRQIVAEGVEKDIRTLEAAILKSVDAAKDDAFYNMHNADGKYIPSGPLTEDHKKKIGLANKGKKKPDLATRNLAGKGKKLSSEHRKKISEMGKGKNLGKLHTEDSKRLMSKNRKGLTAGDRNPMYGKTHNKDARKKISETAKKTRSCPICGYSANVGNYGRWHGKDCKSCR